MGILNLPSVADAERLYQASLFKSFDQAVIFVEPLALIQPVATGEVEVIGALANTQMEEWLGERVIKDISLEAYTIAVKTYSNAVGIPVNAFEDDKWGLYTSKINAMGQSAGQLESRLIAAIYEGTASATGYDSKALLANDHPVLDPEDKTTTVDNYVTATLSRTSYEAARLHFASQVDDSGEPLGIVPSHILVKEGGAADIAATELFEAQQIYDTVLKPNPYVGKVQVIRNPYISSSTFWCLLVLNRIEKPVILFRRYDRPQFTLISAPESSERFLRDRILAGTKYRCFAAVGPYYTAYGSTGAG